jgi:hypothetical protein
MEKKPRRGLQQEQGQRLEIEVVGGETAGCVVGRLIGGGRGLVGC